MSDTTKQQQPQIPKIGHTEDIPTEQKIIHQKWQIPQIGFYWMIAEIDPEKELAFGYANLNDDYNAEWGYISLAELRESGASQDKSWIPKKFSDAKRDEELKCLI